MTLNFKPNLKKRQFCSFLSLSKDVLCIRPWLKLVKVNLYKQIIIEIIDIYINVDYRDIAFKD